MHLQKQVIQPAFLVHLASQVACLVADSHVDVAPARRTNRATRILIQCKTRILAVDRHPRADPGQGRIEKRKTRPRIDRFVRRDTTICNDRLVQTSPRIALVHPEKDKPRIMIYILIHFRRMHLEILDHLVETQLILRYLATIDKQVGDTAIFVSVVTARGPARRQGADRTDDCVDDRRLTDTGSAQIDSLDAGQGRPCDSP